MALKGLITILGCDLIFVILAIPLVLRKVPPNVVYGFRTPTTLRDEIIWYETNAYFGRGLLVSSVITALLILVLYRAREMVGRFFIPGSLAALVFPSLVAAVLAWRFSRSPRARRRPSGFEA